MSLEQLMGRYFRLKQELAMVQTAQPWHSGRIDRITKEIGAVEAEIAALRPAAGAELSALRHAA